MKLFLVLGLVLTVAECTNAAGEAVVRRLRTRHLRTVSSWEAVWSFGTKKAARWAIVIFEMGA